VIDTNYPIGSLQNSGMVAFNFQPLSGTLVLRVDKSELNVEDVVQVLLDSVTKHVQI